MSPTLEREQNQTCEVIKIGGSTIFYPDRSRLRDIPVRFISEIKKAWEKKQNVIYVLKEITSNRRSIVFSPQAGRFNSEYIDDLLTVLKNELDSGKNIVAVVGGGIQARERTEDAKRLKISNSNHLDKIAIGVTKNNARVLAYASEARGMTAELHRSSDASCAEPGMHFYGGDAPGNTTDYIAINAANELESRVVFIISSIDGLYRKKGDSFIVGDIVENISLTEYIDKYSVEHSPGVNTPIDKPAAILANQSGITIALVGTDLDNLKRCMSGEDFIGTVLHPKEHL